MSERLLRGLPYLLLLPLGLVTWLTAKPLFAPPMSEWHLPLWFFGLIGVTIVDGVYCWDRLQRALTPKATSSRGSAHWASGRELAVYTAPRHDCALMLGHSGGTQIALSEQRQQEHVLITGTTGKGKTANILVPGLLREDGRRSLFILDVKHEQVRLTAGAVAERHTLWVVAPDDPAQSVGYNPLACIQSFEDAVDFGRCWVQNTGWAREPFYNDIAISLIAGVALHLRATEPAAPLSRLADLLVTQPFGKLYAELVKSLARPVKDAVAPQLHQLAKDEQLRGSVMTGLANRLLLLQSDAVRQVTSQHTVDFVHMVEQPTALYLAIPADAASRLKPLSACLLMQMFSTWLRLAAHSPQGRLSRQVVCYLDEFGNAGTIPQMGEHITMLRSVNVALILAVQNFAQLTLHYGMETAKTIRDNASTHVVLRGIGQDEAEFYSRRIGMTTVKSRSQHAISSGERRQGELESARALITPDEIRTLPDGHMLVLADVAAPVRVRARPYYRDKRLARRANLPVPWPSGHAGPVTPPPPAAPDA
jgi:type IV secretion system protein VirD4